MVASRWFTVNRWFAGAHPARVIHLDGSAVFLVEPLAAGIIPALLARPVSGDAISLVRGEPVFVAAFGSERTGYAPAVCCIGSVPLASPEGRDCLEKAVAMFSPGLDASQMPATDVVAEAGFPVPAPATPWLPAAAFAGGAAPLQLLQGRPAVARANALSVATILVATA